MWHWGLRAYIWYFSVSKTIYFVFYHLLIQFPDGFVPRHAFWLRLSSEIAHFGSRLVSDGAILMLRWPATTPKFMKKTRKIFKKSKKIFFHIISYDDVGTFEKRQSVSFRSETHSKLAPKIPMWSQDGQAPPQIDQKNLKNLQKIKKHIFSYYFIGWCGNILEASESLIAAWNALKTRLKDPEATPRCARLLNLWSGFRVRFRPKWDALTLLKCLCIILWNNMKKIFFDFLKIFWVFSWILVYIFWLTMRFSASRHYWQSDELSPSSDGVRRRAAA